MRNDRNFGVDKKFSVQDFHADTLDKLSRKVFFKKSFFHEFIIKVREGSNIEKGRE